MNNKKFEELNEYQRKRLETAEECANDIKNMKNKPEKQLATKLEGLC